MRPSSLRYAKSTLPNSLDSILASTSSNPSQPLLVSGWIKSVRSHKSVTFLEISDGSSSKTLQAVLKGKAKDPDLDGLTLGTSLSLTGTLQKSRGSGQAQELVIQDLKVLGSSNPEQYPIQKKHLPPDVLRDHAHLRFRTAHFGALMRVRDSLMREWHDYFEENEFVHVHTPILTSSDCEGAGETFRVTTLPPPLKSTTSQDPTSLPSSPKPPHPTPQDFFPTPSYLTVSSQLHLESPTLSLSRCYTLSPTFRAEPSSTSRHLAEFYMLEAEVAWVEELEGLMGTIERGIKKVLDGIVNGKGRRGERLRDDMKVIWESVGKDSVEGAQTERTLPNLEMLKDILEKPWHRMTYTESIKVLSKRHLLTPFDHEPIWGSSLQTEHEKYLAGSECLDGPVFITDYPQELKPFYMRVNDHDDGSELGNGKPTVACFDLLIPHIGELAGGSLREERFPLLESSISSSGLSKENYEWYLDGRRFGSVPHGGWGMGWERFLCWLTGIGNVRDVVAFPRWKGSCRY